MSSSIIDEKDFDSYLNGKIPIGIHVREGHYFVGVSNGQVVTAARLKEGTLECAIHRRNVMFRKELKFNKKTIVLVILCSKCRVP